MQGLKIVKLMIYSTCEPGLSWEPGKYGQIPHTLPRAAFAGPAYRVGSCLRSGWWQWQPRTRVSWLLDLAVSVVFHLNLCP